MVKIPMWRRCLRFFGSNAEADVEDELRFHLDAKVDELVAQGLTYEEARAEARREFGDVTSVSQMCQQLQRGSDERKKRREYFVGWRQDVTYGWRQLRHCWGSTLLAVVTLGIGVGAVAAVFSIVYAVVLRPLPFPNPDRIVTVWSTREGHDDEVTPRNFDSWRRDGKSFQQLAALERSTFTLGEADNAVQVSGGEVSSAFFSVFGVDPLLGRTFTSSEDIPPRQHLVVLSHRLWQERFAGDRGVIGRQIHLNREFYMVIGVMPERFDLRPDGEQLWTPLALSDQEMSWSGVLYVFGRLRPDVTLRQAQAEMAVMSRLLQIRYPDINRGRDIRIGEFAGDLVGGYRQQLLILLAAVGSVFLIACANVANLLLARGAGRTRELTIRAALGATRSRIIRQLLTESFLLGIAGAGLGLAVAAGAIHFAKLAGASSVPRIGEAGVNVTVLMVLVGLAVSCTLLSGMLPALRAARLEPQGALVQGGRSAAGLARDHERNAYIAVEVGLALVLLVAAGLLIRTAIASQSVQPGFVADRVVAGRTALPSTQYKTAEQVGGAYERIIEAIAAQPGVVSAALTSKVPLSTSALGVVLKADAVLPPLRDEFSTEMQYVSPGYFATMQIPVRRGREFGQHDRVGAVQVVLVNETLARRLWPGRDAVGQQLRLPELDSGNPLWEVAGVVADAHDDGLVAAVPAVLYVPVAQVPTNPWHWTEDSLYVVARTRTAAGPELLRAALQTVDSGLPLGDVKTMDERLAQSVASAHFYTLLLTILGMCGLVLTAAGIYGVVAYFVSRQRGEIGIRMALGATRRNVLIFVVQQGMRPVLAGTVVGVVMSLIVSRLLAAQLYGVGATDPFTFAAVTGVLLVIALFACYVPARQAALVDPVVALRGE
jgi:putative ABC transport system permease protein